MGARNRVALVTGTSSGIGAALAAALLRERWAVVGLARRSAGFKSPDYEHLQIDLGDLPQLRDMAEAHLGSILSDVRWTRVALVNNAAVPGSFRRLEEADPLGLASVLAVNTVAPIFLMGLMTRLVPHQTALRIVNISSAAAIQEIPGLGDYGSSKSALRLAAMVMATELQSRDRPDNGRRNAAILSYEPGMVDTAMQKSARSAHPATFPSSDLFQGVAAQGQLQSPEAVIGEIIEFLRSDGAEPFVEKRFSNP